MAEGLLHEARDLIKRVCVRVLVRGPREPVLDPTKHIYIPINVRGVSDYSHGAYMSIRNH